MKFINFQFFEKNLSNKLIPIKKPIFAIKGERGTGTRFFRKILNYYFDNSFENIHSSKYDSDGYYGWKHGYIFEDELKKINEDQVIICIINKDIFSWLLSIFTNPYELKKEQTNSNFTLFFGKKNDFKSFIQSTNRVYDNFESWIKEFYQKEGIYDSYASVYDLRYKKYHSMLNEKIERKIYFKYEDLLSNHFNIVLAISDKYNLEITKPQNATFDNYFKRNFYLQKEYMKLYSPKMIKTVEQNIDLNLENKMGYFI